jgi:RNA recognition motif-containing protein
MELWPPPQADNARSSASSNWREKGSGAGASGHRKPRQGDGRTDADAEPSGPTTFRLYVGNLDYTVQPNVIHSLFNNHNYAVVQLDMSIDPMSGRNPSYCFVDLSTPQECERAMQELNGTMIVDRPVKIGPVNPKKASPSGLGTKSTGGAWKNGKCLSWSSMVHH